MARQCIISDLKERFIFLYPDYKTKTYFLPPVIISRIPLESETVVNQTVLTPKSSEAQHQSIRKNKTLDKTSGAICNQSSIISPGFQYSDLREDFTLQLVKSRLETLARVQNEVMFVLTQLDFSDYLSKPCYSSTIEKLRLKTPRHLEKNEYKRGDFDLLLFHKKYGILIGEIKSVGSPHIQQTGSQITNDFVIRDKMNQAIKQLVKSEAVIKELTKDLEPNVRIIKTVILPYIWRTDLLRVIRDDVQLKNNLVSCLNVKDDIHAIDLCLLADNVSDIKGSWKIHQMQSWWETCKEVSKEDTLMNDDLYLDIVVRFCGPATTIRVHCIKSPRLEVRTKGDAVSIVGERMAQLILTPEQLQILCEMPRNVFLCGPPGTGKSVLLALMALKYLHKGDEVYIVSTVSINIAASLALKHMLEKTRANTTIYQHGDIHYVQAYLDKSDDELTKLIATIRDAAKTKTLFVIVDEVWARDEVQIGRHFQCAMELCKLDRVNIWIACLRHDKIPSVLNKITLTIPLRSPPTVLEEIEISLNWYTEEKMHMYNTANLSAPCDGPAVIHLQHKGHEKRWPTNCEECGKAVGKVLSDLGVGEGTGNSDSNPDDDTKKAPPLKYGDVFVLTGSTNLQSCGFATGLCQSGISEVRVLTTDSSVEEREDVALARNNEVIVTWYLNVMGLERKVVVFLPHRNESDDNRTDDELEAYGRNHAMSRCTSQLIVVHTSLSRESVNDI